jgi:hypothetical protein
MNVPPVCSVECWSNEMMLAPAAQRSNSRPDVLDGQGTAARAGKLSAGGLVGFAIASGGYRSQAPVVGSTRQGSYALARIAAAD